MSKTTRVEFTMRNDKGVDAGFDVATNFLKHVPELLPAIEAETCLGSISNGAFSTALTSMRMRNASSQYINRRVLTWLQVMIKTGRRLGIDFDPDAIAQFIREI